MTINNLSEGFYFAMHGGGAYKGLRQTNTLEAILYWYSKGVRIFELDMAETCDGDFVAIAHHLNRKDLRRTEVFNLPESCSADWFMQQRLFSISVPHGLTPLSVTSIIKLLNEKDDIIIIFDLFGLFSKEETARFTRRLCTLVTSPDLGQRILVETYNEDMVDGIRAINDEISIIMSVRSELNDKELFTISASQLVKKNIRFVSYPWLFHRRFPDEIRQYSEAGIVVLSRTKFNTNVHSMYREGVKINLIAKHFDSYLMPFQWILYMLTYIKRIAIKIYIGVCYK